MLSRPARVIVQGLTLTTLVGGTVAFASFDKSVDVVVDGQQRSVHAFGSTVRDVLRSEGLVVGGHDIVSPALGSSVQDGSEIVVQYGRRLVVSVDGQPKEFWTTALAVDDALTQVGLRTDSARLSVSRSQALGRSGLSMRLDTRKQVQVMLAGRQRDHVTFAATVGELLTELGATVGPLDRVVPGVDRPLVDGAVVRYDRVERRQVTVTEPVAFPVQSTSSAALDKGTTKVTTKGRPGAARYVYEDTFVNGRRADRDVVTRTVLRKAQPQVQQVGTREQAPTRADSLNWPALAKCESGGNPRAVNAAGYYGLYQFALPTWRRVGGTGNPIDASPAEQLKRAKMLYARGGASQWGCGHHLFD